MTQYDKELKLSEIFSSQREFEKEVLLIKNAIQREEVLDIIAKNLVYNTLKHQLHFYYIKKIDDIVTTNIENSISQVIIEEFLFYLKEELSFSKVESSSTVAQKEVILFINALASFYYKRYHFHIFSLSADTLFEKIDSTPEANRFLKECVECDSENGGLMYSERKSRIFYSYERAYAKIHSVMLIKKTAIKKVQLKLTKVMIAQNEEASEELESSSSMLLDELNLLQDKPLDRFDNNLYKVKKAIVDAMYML